MMTVGITFFKDYCETCLSNEYVKRAQHWSRAVPDSPATPVYIKQMPLHIQLSVLSKMNQKSLTRIRRTNSFMCQLVEKNRHQIRLAMFHNYVMRFRMDGTVLMEPPPDILDTTAPSEGDCNDFRVAERDVTFDLTNWDTNEQLKKELYGCYRPSLAIMGFQYRLCRNDEAVRNICSFLEWANIKNTHVLFVRAPHEDIMKISNVCIPRAIALYRCINCPTDLMRSDCFENVVQLSIYCCALTNPDIGKQIRNIEFYQVENADRWHNPTINQMIQLWRSGEGSLKRLYAWCNDQTGLLDGLEAVDLQREDVDPEETGANKYFSTQMLSRSIVDECPDKIYELQSTTGNHAVLYKFMFQLYFNVYDEGSSRDEMQP